MTLRRAAILAACAGALGSLALMLRAGERTPRFLLLLFVIWIGSPFVALAWALVLAKQWALRAQRMLYVVALVIAAGSLAIYSNVIDVAPAGSANAFRFVIVAPSSWVLMITAAVAARR